MILPLPIRIHHVLRTLLNLVVLALSWKKCFSHKSPTNRPPQRPKVLAAIVSKVGTTVIFHFNQPSLLLKMIHNLVHCFVWRYQRQHCLNKSNEHSGSNAERGQLGWNFWGVKILAVRPNDPLVWTIFGLLQQWKFAQQKKWKASLNFCNPP